MTANTVVNQKVFHFFKDVSFLCNRGRKLLFTIFHCNAIVYNICSNDSIYLATFHNSVYLEMFLLTSAAPPVTSLVTSPPRPDAEWVEAVASLTTAPGCCCCCCCCGRWTLRSRRECPLWDSAHTQGGLNPLQPDSWSSSLPGIREGSYGQFNPNTT